MVTSVTPDREIRSPTVLRWAIVALGGATLVSALLATQTYLASAGAGFFADWWRAFAAYSVP